MGAGRDDGDETKRSYLYISIPPNAGVCEIRENQMHTGVQGGAMRHVLVC